MNDCVRTDAQSSDLRHRGLALPPPKRAQRAMQPYFDAASNGTLVKPACATVKHENRAVGSHYIPVIVP